MLRVLTPGELELLSWVLPEDREGYRSMRELVLQRDIAARGRRGEGHWILAAEGVEVDHDAPLPQVLALGVVIHAGGETSVLVREPLGDQVDIEITGDIPTSVHRRWTLSTWEPGQVCPQCGGTLRETVGTTRAGNVITLTICSSDRRVWVHNRATGVSHPIPVTLYYSELMRATGTKDPAVALDAPRLFSQTDRFRDRDLLRAFSAYNDIRSKIGTEDRLIIPNLPGGFFTRLFSSFRRRS